MTSRKRRSWASKHRQECRCHTSFGHSPFQPAPQVRGSESQLTQESHSAGVWGVRGQRRKWASIGQCLACAPCQHHHKHQYTQCDLHNVLLGFLNCENDIDGASYRGRFYIRPRSSAIMGLFDGSEAVRSPKGTPLTRASPTRCRDQKDGYCDSGTGGIGNVQPLAMIEPEN